jgi:cell division protease FtsH
MPEFEEAIERVIAGPGRKSRIISQHEKEIIAYHEAGHAVAAYHLPNCDPVHKVTIVARGLAGGYTMALPEEERRLESRIRLIDNLAFILGGRAAEEIVFGDVTTGASNDLERVTEITRSMVTRFGMSDKLGPMVFGQKEELVFLGKELGEQRDYSEAVAQEIDTEVRRLVSSAFDHAKDILNQHHDKLDIVARRLIEVETIDGKEFEALMKGQPLEPPTPPQSTPPSPQPRPASSESSNWQVSPKPAPLPA